MLRVQPATEEEKVKQAASIFLTLFVLLCVLLIRLPIGTLTSNGAVALGGAIGLTGYIGFSLALTVLERRD